MPTLRAALLLCATTAASAFAASPPFSEAGVAFLEKHCTSCHGAEKQKAGLVLHDIRNDAALLRAPRRWKEIMNMVESGQMPPEEQPPPTREEKRAFLDSVRSVFARANNASPDPGRITVRRLNRTEYNNTVRDLLKVEHRPADDFPSDDVGFGFDNIADVLSVSPVLMERYLAAAEKIAEEAIPITAARPPRRTMAGKYCEPASATVPQDRFRPICATEKEYILSGPLNTPARIEAGNTYYIRARLFARSANGAPVKVALLAVGKELKRPNSPYEAAALDGAALVQSSPFTILKAANIAGRDENHAEIIEAKIVADSPIERMAIAAFKPPHGQPPPQLFVEYLEQEGPLDPRSAVTKALMVFTPGQPEREQAREVLAPFATRAWRRPVQPDELDRLCAIVDYAVGHNEGWEGGMRRAITAVLASPKFIFRLEPDHEPNNPAPHPLDEFQLATRLSYFLWSSCPDDELLRAAADRQLAANLDAHVRRMLQDPRAAALVDSFFMQWLQLGRIAGHSADAKVFPKWQPELRASMIEETRRFCADVIREDRSILDLLTADFSWVDRRLAELYGLPPPPGNEWQRVSLKGTARGGLLTHASVLTVTSNPTRTSPVKRGKWLLEQILGAPPPPAPPDVPSLDDKERTELRGSFREKLEQHRADPQCGGCHAKMDALGLALENFDGIGQWRERDETGAPVDASTKFPGGPKLDGARGLKTYLREHSSDFTRCFSEKMLIYALGRGLEYSDDAAVDRIQSAIAKDGHRFSALVREIVKSDPFRLRRGQAQQPLPSAPNSPK